MMIRSQIVIDTAQGAPCSVRFPGICNGNPETTVWCHLNGARFGKGAMLKAHDILGFHGCSSCHAYYDVGHGTRPLLSNDTLLECVLSAVCETYVRLVKAEVILVPQDREKPASERPVKPRKAKADRHAIPAHVDPWPTGQKIPSRPMRGKAARP
jgi:hypothetical protein